MEEVEVHKSLIAELTQGKEMAVQLRTHLHPSSCSSPEACLFLTEMIHSSFEKALLILNFSPNSNSMAIPVVEQQQSTDNKLKNSTNRHVLKRRKLIPRWTEEVKVCSTGTDLEEGPLNDGYHWRKYGQKHIHNANFPRCYYRCSHRHVRGCLATKQVQKSDTCPNVFEVKYRGRHTCNQSSNLSLISVSNQNEIPQETNQNQQNPNSEILFNFGELQHFDVESEDFDQVFPPFADNVLLPAAAAETAWDWSVCGGGIQSSEESDATEIILATTSGTNSPIGNGDWSLSYDDKIDFDEHFPFQCFDF